MSARSTRSLMVLASAAVIGLIGVAAPAAGQDGSRAPRNLQEFDAMFREHALRSSCRDHLGPHEASLPLEDADGRLGTW